MVGGSVGSVWLTLPHRANPLPIPFPLSQDAATATRTIVQVVAHCHSLGVIHRDLKPENFLLASKADDAVLKATDFGLSAFFKPGQARGLVVCGVV